jgi:hypothetical protein
MNVMIDLETMSTKPRAAIASLGAVLFDPYREQTVDELMQPTNIFYMRCDLRTQPQRHFDPDTIYWWLRQSHQARASLAVNPMPIHEVLKHFTDFLTINQVKRGWSFGANFDHVVVQTMYNDFKAPYQIRYSEQLCARTICKMSGVTCPDSGVGHDALDDAVRQARWLQSAFKALGIVS